MVDVQRGPMKLKLQIWDLPGTDRCHQFVHSYLRVAECAMIGYDITDWESFESVYKWVSVEG